jgi:hypothetical protein
MTERMDAVTAREYEDSQGNKKTAWTKIGSAWPTRNGGWSISLDALPLPTLGERGLETRIMLMVPKARDEQPRRQQSARRDRDDPRTMTQRYDLDDDSDLPF